MKLQLSYQNQFQFGYNREAFNFRKTPDDVWWVDYGKCHRPTLSFREECFKTAKLIEANAQGEIVLLLSGGIDSEVMLQSFLHEKIKFKVAIMQFENDLNEHDVHFAKRHCDKYSIKPYIFKLDLVKFWHDNLFTYADPVYSVSPQVLPHMWLVDQIDGYPVMGSGECLLVKRRPFDYIPGVSPYEHDDWRLFEKEKIASWYRHLIVRDREGCMGFFQYNPEIILSFLVDPFVKRLTNSEIVGKLSSASSKHLIYSQHFELEIRDKHSGFEKVKSWDTHFRTMLVKKYGHANACAISPVNELIQKMSYQP